MSYITYLSSFQKNNRDGDQFTSDEEEENNIDSDSDEENESKKKSEVHKKEDILTTPNTHQLFSQNPDYQKQFVLGEGYGKEFLKSEIERLAKLL